MLDPKCLFDIKDIIMDFFGIILSVSQFFISFSQVYTFNDDKSIEKCKKEILNYSHIDQLGRFFVYNQFGYPQDNTDRMNTEESIICFFNCPKPGIFCF